MSIQKSLIAAILLMPYQVIADIESKFNTIVNFSSSLSFGDSEYKDDYIPD